MFRIDAAHLCWVLENLVEGAVVNRITVDADTAEWAKVALQRMLTSPRAQAQRPAGDGSWASALRVL